VTKGAQEGLQRRFDANELVELLDRAMTVSLVGSEGDAARQYAVSHAADYLYYELPSCDFTFLRACRAHLSDVAGQRTDGRVHRLSNFGQQHHGGVAQPLFDAGQKRAVDAGRGGQIPLAETQFGAPLKNVGTDRCQHRVFVDFCHLLSLSW
jgi:hypothetical protein